MFSILGEDFACNQTNEDYGNDYVGAYNAAVDLSLRNDMDWVFLLASGVPVLKIVDGEEQKKWKL